MKRLYCDACGAELTPQNSLARTGLHGGPLYVGLPPIRLNGVRVEDESMRPQVCVMVHGVGEFDLCRYCILNTVRVLDDRLRDGS